MAPIPIAVRRALALLSIALIAGCGRNAPPVSAWQPLPLGTVAEFRSLWFADAMNGWIAGGSYQIAGGLIGRTRDGGKSWQFTSNIVSKLPRTTHLSVQSVRFFDDRRGLIAVDGGIIMKTVDGGENWALSRPGSAGQYLFDLDFIDDRNGWVVGPNGVLRTQDGGDTWVRLGERDAPRIPGRAIHFLDQYNGWLVGQFATLVYTGDGGATWNAESVPLVAGEKPHLTDVWFVDDRNGWVVGDEGTILHTTDGGDTWLLQPSGVPDARSVPRPERIQRGGKVELIDTGDRTPGLSLTSVRFVDKARGWTVGHYTNFGRSLILRTEDGGTTWAIDADIAGEELRALFVLDAEHAWAVGARTREGPQSIYRRGAPAAK